MSPVQKHLRNTFLAGIFAAIPVGVTVFLVWYVENVTRAPLRRLFGDGRFDIPFIGIPITLLLVYLLGLAVTSIMGKWMLGALDRLLLRLPILKELYQAWKQITITPGGGGGMYARVVLVCIEGDTRVLGFTSGDPIPGDPETLCVFIPHVPNPIAGRLHFVARARCQFLEMSAEEAFKFLLSTANYIPPEIGAATCAPLPNQTLR